MSEAGGSASRLSQGASVVRKGARLLPTYRNDHNFGRASGKLMNIGEIARDEDGFEDFEGYLKDNVFTTPPPAITTKPKPKPKPKPSAKKPAPAPTAELDDVFLEDVGNNEPSTPRQYFARAGSAAPAPPSESRTVGSRSRPAAASTSNTDFDTVPEPAPRRKPLTQSSSSNNKNAAGPSKSQPKAPAAKPNGRALPDIVEEENEDSNMSMASMVDASAGPSRAAPTLNDFDDDSGNEDFGGGGFDDDMEVDQQEPEPEPEDEPPRKSPAKNKSRRDLTPEQSADVPMDDEPDPMDDGDQEMGQPDDQDDEEEPPPPKETEKQRKARLAREKRDAAKSSQNSGQQSPKRAPLRTKDQNAQQSKKVKRTFNQESNSDDDDDENGPRRGKRQRYAPLQWWRGEHAIVRRPKHGEAPVPIIEGIIRIPDEFEPGHPRKPHRRRGTTKPPSGRGGGKQTKETYMEEPDEDEDEGLDADTEEAAVVLDYDTKETIEKVIAQTAAMVDPKQPNGAEYAFQKVFMDGDFIAGGILEIPVKGRKPPKPARDNTYIFYCVEGAVRVMVHQSSFVIAKNGMFMVPRGNQYYLENISNRSCKLFFAQARKVTEKMIPSPTKRTSVLPAVRPSSNTPRAASRMTVPATAPASPTAGKSKGAKKR